MIHQLFAVVFGLNNDANDTAGQLFSFTPLWIPRDGVLFEYDDDCVARGMLRADYIAGNKDLPLSRKEDMATLTRRRVMQAGGKYDTYRTLIYPKQRNIAIAFFGPNTAKNRSRRTDFIEQITANAKGARCMECDERALPALTGNERLYLISPSRTAVVNEQYLKLVKRLEATAKEQQFAVGVVQRNAFDGVPNHSKLPVLKSIDGVEYTHLNEGVNLLYQADGDPEWVYLPTLPETVPHAYAMDIFRTTKGDTNA